MCPMSKGKDLDQVGTSLAQSLGILKPWLREREPKIGIILGSGLGEFAKKSLADSRRIDYIDIPHFPECKADGHAGQLWLGQVGLNDVLVLSGRVHAHEGHRIQTIVHPARVLVRLGVKILIVTNAAGSVNLNYEPGRLVLMRDHINFIQPDPIQGGQFMDENGDPLGEHHTDLSDVYSARLREYAQRQASALGLQLPMGVYAAMPGPSYETPSETRRLQGMGVDLAGMSSAPEAIAAVHMGAEVMGFSCVTNWTGGIAKEKLSHLEVKEVAAQVSFDFMRLVTSVIQDMPFKKERAVAGQVT
ncbi:MAG: purine-nucleoside phosphorylase [Patescibacteria group bacterium]